MKICNEQVKIQQFNNGKLKKQVILKNMITDLGLDALLYKILPSSLKNTIYPDNFGSFKLWMNYAYIKFVDTQVITEASTTMEYENETDESGSYQLTSSNNSKILKRSFGFPIQSGGFGNGLLTGIGFGRSHFSDDFLYAFLDLSHAEITTNQFSQNQFVFTRVDRIESNEIATDSVHLPLYTPTSTEIAEISKITLITENDERYEYEVDDLTWTRESAGVVAITGFENYYCCNEGLFPSEDLYPSETLYPSQDGRYTKVEFQYKVTNVYTDEIRYTTTYVTMQDLDASYNDTELKIKIKMERGDY